MPESQKPRTSQSWKDFKLADHLIKLYEQYRKNNLEKMRKYQREYYRKRKLLKT